MKKLILITMLILAPGVIWAHKIIVGPHAEIKSLRQGIQLAVPGDTVVLNSGIYHEGNIILTKSITLLGNGNPVLDGQSKFETLTIHADGVVVSGITFVNTGVTSIEDLAGVKVLESKNVHITGNNFRNTFFGIYFANSSQCWVEKNILESDAEAEHQIGNGIHLWKCEHMTLNGNRVKGHRDGIYFEFVTNSLITNNYSQGNMRYGLHFMFSHHDDYKNNVFVNNGAGVAVMFTHGVTMEGNTFEHNWGASAYGLLLKEISDSRVTGNRFIENSVGIFMEGTNRMTLSDNLFSKNGYAIRLQASCDANTIAHNNFTANTFDIVTNGSLVLNTINGNYWDKYEGYDLNHDGVGDVPFRPVSLYGMVVEKMPTAVLLWRSFLVFMMDRSEKAMPAITPENLKDNSPSMKHYDLVQKHQ